MKYMNRDHSSHLAINLATLSHFKSLSVAYDMITHTRIKSLVSFPDSWCTKPQTNHDLFANLLSVIMMANNVISGIKNVSYCTLFEQLGKMKHCSYCPQCWCIYSIKEEETLIRQPDEPKWVFSIKSLMS